MWKTETCTHKGFVVHLGLMMINTWVDGMSVVQCEPCVAQTFMTASTQRFFISLPSLLYEFLSRTRVWNLTLKAITQAEVWADSMKKLWLCIKGGLLEISTGVCLRSMKHSVTQILQYKNLLCWAFSMHICWLGLTQCISAQRGRNIINLHYSRAACFKICLMHLS